MQDPPAEMTGTRLPEFCCVSVPAISRVPEKNEGRVWMRTCRLKYREAAPRQDPTVEMTGTKRPKCSAAQELPAISRVRSWGADLALRISGSSSTALSTNEDIWTVVAGGVYRVPQHGRHFRCAHHPKSNFNLDLFFCGWWGVCVGASVEQNRGRPGLWCSKLGSG